MKNTADPTVVEVTITAQQEHMFLKYNSPLDSAQFACKAFQVQNLETGEDLEFTGAIAKRRVPEDEDFHHFDAVGQKVTKKVDLAHCFDFQQDNSYRVNLNAKFMSDMKVTSGDSSRITFLANQNTTPLLKSKSQRANFKVFNNFQGCSADEISTAQDAVTNAITAVSDAITSVLQPGCANADYQRFFGVHTQERYYIVSSNYDNILAQFNSEDYIIVCGDSYCSDSIFAFVYPTDTDHNIYVCGAYHSASVEITYDSKPGTLIHEMSHFNDIAGTDDHQYGVSGNEALADSNPCLAVDNADSHEYFIEQVPSAGGICCADLDTASCTVDLDFCAVSGSDSCMEVSQVENSVGPDTQDGWCDGASPSDCTDLPGADGNAWLDMDGLGPYGCQDYADEGWCDVFGSSESIEGLSAYDACCACGGGIENTAVGVQPLLASLGLYFLSF
jgi:peptidyl-Lys metalloendopeptidase